MNTKDLKDMVRNPYVWPGGYAKVLIMSDGEAMCARCVHENFKLILRATRDKADRSGWCAAGVDVHWEGAALLCCNCNQEMPSEYGE